jgi:hypothetical protein
MFKKGLDYTVHDSKIDQNGRYIILDISLFDQRLTFVSLYGLESNQDDFVLLGSFDARYTFYHLENRFSMDLVIQRFLTFLRFSPSNFGFYSLSLFLPVLPEGERGIGNLILSYLEILFM